VRDRIWRAPGRSAAGVVSATREQDGDVDGGGRCGRGVGRRELSSDRVPSSGRRPVARVHEPSAEQRFCVSAMPHSPGATLTGRYSARGRERPEAIDDAVANRQGSGWANQGEPADRQQGHWGDSRRRGGDGGGQCGGVVRQMKCPTRYSVFVAVGWAPAPQRSRHVVVVWRPTLVRRAGAAPPEPPIGVIPYDHRGEHFPGRIVGA